MLGCPQRRARFASVIGALTLPLVGLATGCDPFHTGFDDLEEAKRYEANEPSEAETPGETLRVMNWNLKFGGGRIDFFFDCHGDRVLMDEGEVLDHLGGLAAKIREVDPDLLLLQEVDVSSKRSAYVDMAQWLLDETELNHGVYASQWRADYVPSDGIGPVDSGTAILSRWPFGQARRIALSQVDAYDPLRRYFYLKRNVLEAELEVPGHGKLWALATHTEAYDPDGTKREHIDRFTELMDERALAGGHVIGGGDLNTVPPGSVQTKDFEDSICTDEDYQADDFSEEGQWLAPLYERFEPAVPLALYEADNTPWFTHSTTSEVFWNRKLDYLFTNLAFTPGETVTHQDASTGLETMSLSDHAPVVATWELSP